MGDDEKENNVVRDNMYVAAEVDDDGTQGVHIAYAINDYVEFEDLPNDEFQDEEWVATSIVENLFAHHNMTIDPSLNVDLNVSEY